MQGQADILDSAAAPDLVNTHQQTALWAARAAFMLMNLVAHHELDDVLFGDASDGTNVHQNAIAQHCHCVCDLLEFFKAVRHVYDRDPPGFQQRDLIKQMTDFPVSQHGRGFIEHQHAGVVLQVAGNLDHLLLPDTQLGDRRCRVDVK